ncbi:hypothetical protein FA15DRAFT_595244 [Coprinopsis marcescibilis]|uniref:Mixed lineage kinase domain-containing protein n=1 Tax=Coprinopsis marcescibilis TaxID=230819 RepID=A0A5C3KQR7_COPMA|nr:hypothetical protein FA15DRAFT_595244 [Coprinopsis marcescibilis]
MDAFSLLTNIISVARGIHSWLDQLQCKKDKLRQLQWRVKTLIDTLQPHLDLQKHDKLPNDGMIDIFLELAAILSSIRERLSVYRAKFRLSKFMEFINPAVLLSRLEDDEKRLSRWIELFSLRLQVNATKHVETLLSLSPTTTVNRDAVIHHCKVGDVVEFWDLCVGNDVAMASPAEFLTGLRCWIRENIDEFLFSSLLSTLDPDNLGSILRKNLDAEVGDTSLKQYVSQLKETLSNGAEPPSQNLMDSDDDVTVVDEDTTSHEEPNVHPTLVWIDDRMQNNKHEIKHAESMGIHVVTLPSTAVAKLWIEENEARLRELERTNSLRFITDNARWEGSERTQMFLNMTAGETILRFLRGKRLTSPVLVYCGESVVCTEYVKLYSAAASTKQADTCLKFLEYLSPLKGRKAVVWDDEEFDAAWDQMFSIRHGWNINISS